MKYKVLYFDNGSGGGSPDAGVGLAFYTFNQAHLSAQAWAALNSTHYTFLWDGLSWRLYS